MSSAEITSHLLPTMAVHQLGHHHYCDSTSIDERAPTIQDPLQNSDALIHRIPDSTMRPSSSNRRNSRRGTSHGTSASLSSVNSATLIAPASQSSDTSSHNDHVRHASTSAINGATHSTPIVDEISKLIFRLATEVSKMREQLRFIKAQYESAIEQISKGQDVINSLEEKHGRAVDEARREREKVRLLEEEIKLKEAQEAGHKKGRGLGMEEGIERCATEGRGVEDGREAEPERLEKATRDLVEDDQTYEPQPPRDGIQESSELHEIYNRVGDETPGLSNSSSHNVNPTISPVVTVDPQTNTFNVIGLPLLQTGNPITVTYMPAVPASLSIDPSASVGNREQPNRGHGLPNYSVSSPQDNPNISILSRFEDELVMSAPRLSREAFIGTRDNQTSAPSRINSSSVDRDGERSDPTQQRSWGGRVVGNGQGYRAPIRQRSGSGGTNGTTGTGVSRTPARASVTPSFSSLDRSALLDQHGDRGSYGGRLTSQVAEMTPITEAGSDLGPMPTPAYYRPSPSTVTAAPHNSSHPHQPPLPSASQSQSTNLAQSTPRHFFNPLDTSPEEVMTPPNGTAVIYSGRFDAGRQYTGAFITATAVPVSSHPFASFWIS
jgi:hypothetical protein